LPPAEEIRRFLLICVERLRFPAQTTLLIFAKARYYVEEVNQHDRFVPRLDEQTRKREQDSAKRRNWELMSP
jgi:hypothetical protein